MYVVKFHWYNLRNTRLQRGQEAGRQEGRQTDRLTDKQTATMRKHSEPSPRGPSVDPC